MYAASVIANKESAANIYFRRKYGVDLTRHSIDQVEFANTQIEYLRNDRGELSHVPPDIARHIENERILCRIDFHYWSSRYSWIKTYDNRLIRFSPNIAQQIFLSLLGEMEEEGKELMFQFLKARRLGVSTISQLCVEHRLQFRNNLQAIIGSDNPEDSDKLSKMLFLSFEKQPKWLRPKCGFFNDDVGRYKTGLFYEFDNGNRLDLEHGSQESDIGRGENPTVGHLSELAKMINAISLIDAGLMRAIIPSPAVFWVFEGTADGDDNWWARKYRYNKANYGKMGGSARMRPTFLPWFVGRDIYPTPMWLSTNEWERVKGSWQPKEATIKHATKARDYVAVNPLLRKHLGEGWVMPLEQMYFYECSIKEYKENGILHKWLQEMAGDDEEAFQSRAFSIYDAELRMDMRNSLSNPHAVYALQGKDIPPKFNPSNREREKGGFSIRAKWAHSLPPFDFQFVPLKFTGYSETDPNNKLFIWEPPCNGETYYMAVDTSDGLGVDRSDNTVIQVLRKGDRYRNDAQVAEFASPELSGANIWPWVLAIGTYYSIVHKGKLTQPETVVETNREGGRELLKHLQNRGWSNFYYHMRGKTPTLGIHVTRTNRQGAVGDDSIVQNFNQAVNNGYLKINSYWLIGELDSFIKWPTGKIAAADGKHDDRIFAMAESFYAAYSLALRSSQPEPFIDRTREVPAVEKYPLYTNTATSSDVPYGKRQSTQGDWY